VAITTPGNNTILTAPATFTVTASASDTDGSIAKVEFYKGATLIGTATSAPYSVALSDAAAGVLTLTATAIDNRGASSTSAPVTVIVNSLPSVLLTSPRSNAAFKAPASIPLAVQVADTDGSIANVEYFYGTTLITSLGAPPYSFVWTEVPQGTYALTARATDNLGGTVASVPVNVTVNAAEAKLYYIHVDHLNTPRLVADDQQRTVWRWDQQEPFGGNVPDENPSGVGLFELPLRLPGQFHDKETGLYYNAARDYDPSGGRYIESDPVGLRAGLSTYAYGLSSPLVEIDPFGLDVIVTYFPGFPGHIGIGIDTSQTVGLYPVLQTVSMMTCSTVAGVVARDQTLQMPKHLAAARSLAIKTEPGQDELMQNYINRLQGSASPAYNLCVDQCQSFVHAVLIAGGVARPASPTAGSLPADYYDALQSIHGGQRRKQ
jgi:RHS repeat-associated protein